MSGYGDIDDRVCRAHRLTDCQACHEREHLEHLEHLEILAARGVVEILEPGDTCPVCGQTAGRDGPGVRDCNYCGSQRADETAEPFDRENDRYPYSAVINGTRVCAVCDREIRADRYADHWTSAHPRETAYLYTIEADPYAVDRWGLDSFRVPAADGPRFTRAGIPVAPADVERLERADRDRVRQAATTRALARFGGLATDINTTPASPAEYVRDPGEDAADRWNERNL